MSAVDTSMEAVVRNIAMIWRLHGEPADGPNPKELGLPISILDLTYKALALVAERDAARREVGQMRDVTPEMQQAGWRAMDRVTGCAGIDDEGCSFCTESPNAPHACRNACVAVYRAMEQTRIEAALGAAGEKQG